MLVAFLCDLALLESSKGKVSVTDVIRELYKQHRSPAARMDGNTAVLDLLRSHAELRKLIDKNIVGAENIDWSTELAAVGIEAVKESPGVSLKVTVKPSGRQKDLLDKLGYNNWRNLSQSLK